MRGVPLRCLYLYIQSDVGKLYLAYKHIIREEYDLGEQLRRCAILMLPQIQEKKIDFRSPEETPLPYYGNEEIMEHVWLNLLGNAVKFTPAGGVITVTYGQRDGVIDVRIADSGPGMSEEVRRHIFDRYYQEKGMKSTKGNGIGLAIVKRIVDLCEGEIEVTGGPGEGSCFTVKLPV